METTCGLLSKSVTRQYPSDDLLYLEVSIGTCCSCREQLNSLICMSESERASWMLRPLEQSISQVIFWLSALRVMWRGYPNASILFCSRVSMESTQESASTSLGQSRQRLQTVHPWAQTALSRSMRRTIFFILEIEIDINIPHCYCFHRIQYIIIMGNQTLPTSGDESAVEIVGQKNEIEFQQNDFIKEIEGSIEEEYELLSPCLEQNEFYELRKAIHLKTTLTRAVYIVNKYKIRSHERAMFEEQIHKLIKIDHFAMPKIYELFKNNHRFFVVIEYRQGESLATTLERQKYFDEATAASIMWQLLGLLSHCHRRDIIHTDLKLTGIFFNSKQQETIRVQDFSISKIFRIEEIIEQSLGRAVLTAPENVTGNVTSKSDIWSCGVILYILLCGEPPIIANTKIKLVNKFKSFFLRFKERRFRYVSEEGKEMIRRMLRINPNERPSADELMESGWFQRFVRSVPLPGNSLRRCLKELYYYHCSSRLQEATWIFFVNALISFDEKQQIMAVFMKIDRGSKGELDQSDLVAGFVELLGEEKYDFAEECARHVMVRLRKTKLGFSQFLTYCANRFFLIREVNITKVFRIFDQDGSGEIEICELRDTLGNSKEIKEEEVWLQLLQEADSNSDGKISYDEFNDLIRQFNYADKMSQIDLINPFEDE